MQHYSGGKVKYCELASDTAAANVKKHRHWYSGNNASFFVYQSHSRSAMKCISIGSWVRVMVGMHCMFSATVSLAGLFRRHIL